MIRIQISQMLFRLNIYGWIWNITWMLKTMLHVIGFLVTENHTEYLPIWNAFLTRVINYIKWQLYHKISYKYIILILLAATGRYLYKYYVISILLTDGFQMQLQIMIAQEVMYIFLVQCCCHLWRSTIFIRR